MFLQLDREAAGMEAYLPAPIAAATSVGLVYI
jgi:hypothetical protein